jgi:putative hydrolase of the HAD superfamily
MDSLVVFDVDDTLYLERDYVASGFEALDSIVAAKFRVPGFSAIAWRLFSEGCRGNTFDRALSEMGVEYVQNDVAELVTAYRNHFPRISLLPDARDALDILRRCGVSMAVLTDGPVASQMRKVSALGLRSYTGAIVFTGAYDGSFAKPHKRGYRDIARSCSATRLAYVADNPIKDFVAPAQLGWTTIRVRRPEGLYARVPNGRDVSCALEDLDELAEVLRSHGIICQSAILK